MAQEAAIDRRAPGDGLDALAAQPMADGARAPAGVLPAQLEDAGFDLGGHLMRAGLGLGRPVDQPGKAVGRVTAQPVVHGLAHHPIARATSVTVAPSRTSHTAL